MRFARVTIDPDVMGGMPCIRGLRIPVATVVAMVADQRTSTEILAELPDLEAEDVVEAGHDVAHVRDRGLTSSSDDVVIAGEVPVDDLFVEHCPGDVHGVATFSAFGGSLAS